MYLTSPLSEIKGVGPKKYDLFKKLNLFRVEDLLSYYPRRYVDRRHILSIAEIKKDMTCTVRGTVIDITASSPYGKKQHLKIKISDGQFFMDIIFFNAKYVSGLFKPGKTYLFYGRVVYNQASFAMTHPDFTSNEKPSDLFLRVQPIYGLTEGLHQKDVFNTVKHIFDSLIIQETLPQALMDEYNLCRYEEAIKNIHFPVSRGAYKAAKYRLIFEEFFVLQMGLLMLKKTITCHKGLDFKMTKAIKGALDAFIDHLSYEMTGAQKRVMTEIYEDMLDKKVMNRLIQGDVGSGKTLLAMLSIYFTKLNGYQSALMVPTEILAEQHFESFQEMFKDVDIHIGLLTRNTKNDLIKEQIASGVIDVVIGTHALIQEEITFKSLGLAITDEQHRFGVNQRHVLSEKGRFPEVLVMTATPIPRTLSLILYGDIDISRVDEMPANRLPIKTSWVPKQKIPSMYDFIRSKVLKGSQAYIVYPLVETSDVLDLKDVTSMYEALSKGPFKDLKTGLVHGRMKAKEKDEVMKAFEKNEISILFATTVIEVGINVPNATIMVIEHAERFGLAQLHQLRGRVGRGSTQSYCFFVSDQFSEINKKRLQIMCSTNDGFKIADQDLEIRGPGEVFGLKQHGLPEFKIGDLIKHKDILEAAQEAAKAYFYASDFKERLKENTLLYHNIERKFKQFSI